MEIKNNRKKYYSNTSNILKFTGNWFIDAGILGFVNLMEEIYGWDLGRLREELRRDSEVVYYGYFPFAYLYKWLKDRNISVSNSLKKRLIEELEQTSFKNNYELFKHVWSKFVCRIFKSIWIKNKINKRTNEIYRGSNLKPEFNDSKYENLIRRQDSAIKDLLESDTEIRDEIKSLLNKRGELKKLEFEELEILLDSSEISSKLNNLLLPLKEVRKELKDYLDKLWELNVVESFKIAQEKSRFYRLPVDSGFYKNFLFYNYSAGNLEQCKSFYDAISFNLKSNRILSRIDKTVNKFLPSKKEFSNIYYAELSSKIFKEEIPWLFVYLLCFIYAFTNFRGIGYVIFYSNDIKLTYTINKRLKIHQEKVQDLSSLLKVTWREIIDVLFEYKSYWSLENMYIIRYRRLDNQTQEDVEYIGIPKLQASIIIDDVVRDALNKYIPTPKVERGRKVWIWVLEEFIKNRLLLPHLINYLHEYLGKRLNIKLENRTLIYANSVDARLRELGKDNNLFSSEFFNGYRNVLFEIKEDATNMFLAAKNAYRIFNDPKEREKTASRLLSTIRKRNKYAFTNILLKSFIGKTEKQKEIRNLNKYLFEKIISNDINWENYAFVIVIGLIYGGVENGESEEFEE